MLTRISPRIAAWMAITIGASACVAFVAAKVAARSERHSHPHAHPNSHSQLPTDGREPLAGAATDLHDWMHRQLTISESQEARLEPLERDFTAQIARQRSAIAAAESALALTVRSPQRDNDKVEQALQQLDRAHAQLRRLTLEHFFVMEQHLDSDQAERLRQWTHDSLLRQPGPPP